VRVTRERHGESFSERTRAHLRANVVGYIALFVALSGGVAWANHPGGENTISSIDIINGQVKTPDLNDGAVNSNKVEDQTLTMADLASNSVGAFEIAGTAFRKEDVAAQYTGFAKAYGIPSNAIQSNEISDNTITRADLAPQAEAPAGFSTSVNDTGIICNVGCTEGSLPLPAGTYALFGKITVDQADEDEDDMQVRCQLTSAGTEFDHTQTLMYGDGAGTYASSAGVATLPMQGIRTLNEVGNVNLNCNDADVGDVIGRDLKITAIKLGSKN
jgi:hypothetical protein